MRLYLNLRLSDGKLIKDAEGADYGDLQEAAQRGTEYAEELLKEYQKVTHGTVEITDATGRVIRTMEVQNGHFSEK